LFFLLPAQACPERSTELTPKSHVEGLPKERAGVLKRANLIILKIPFRFFL